MDALGRSLVIKLAVAGVLLCVAWMAYLNWTEDLDGGDSLGSNSSLTEQSKNYPRKVAMYISQLLGGYKLMEIAAHFGMTHYGGVRSAIHRVKADLKGDEKLNRKINSIVKRLDP